MSESDPAAARYQDELARLFATPPDGLPPIFDRLSRSEER
jgi:hypothetical protein